MKARKCNRFNFFLGKTMVMIHVDNLQRIFIKRKVKYRGEKPMKVKVKRHNWFAVSPDGLSEHYKKEYIARELLANAFDEEAREIIFTMEEAFTEQFPRQFVIKICDNDPEGFDNIDDMFTLFRRTKKVDDTQVRGRFNHGEKGVLSLCNRAILTSTKGTVIFNPDGSRTVDETIRTERGSDLKFWVDLDEQEFAYLSNYINYIKIPPYVKVIYLGKEYRYEKPLFKIPATLQTWKSDQKRPYYKNTEVYIYPKMDGEAYILELGIPIQRINYLYSVDIRQKVPLDTKRNAVKSSYLEDLYGQLGNHEFVIEKIEDDDLGEDFVAITLSSSKLNDESAVKLVERKMGSKKLMIANPFDQKANEKAVVHGYTLIQSRDVPKASREAIKNAGVKTTSEAFKVNLVDSVMVPRTKWTDGMRWNEEFAKRFAKFAIHRAITVHYHDNPECSESASYGAGNLKYNVGTLGKGFFDADAKIEDMSSLLIHELAHDSKEENQLPHSSAFIKELERIAGEMVKFLMIQENYDFVKGRDLALYPL